MAIDRRELFEKVAAVTAACGMPDARVTTVEPDLKRIPAIAVIECDRRISQDAAVRLRAMWEEGLKGTPFEGVKAIVLDEGMRVTLLDAQGHVLNRELQDI